MKIESTKSYKVTKDAKGTISNLGILNGSDVKVLLKGFKYDEMFDEWFNAKATIGYEVSEIK